ncbi:hypothetical protein [Streptomyces spirodelae]|uniref:Uncharacterized protein n=1 Tax=Streptomyces spirodelae TaxID=2812904 RepID=A0ABS3WQ66_9ACTN|nr:hypothetical protein [Streptomyces spirodelae]MBO8185268.1 hypothetical protein [Streptomyces spirodelae]
MGERNRVGEPQARLREAEPHLEHLAITRKTVTGLAGRLSGRPAGVSLVEIDIPSRVDIGRFTRKQ